MTHKLIKTELYLLVVSDEEFKEGDWIMAGIYNTATRARPTPVSINQKKVIAHLPLNGSPIIEGVDLLDINLILNYLKELGYWNDFCTFAETFYNEKKHIKDTN